MRILSSTLLSLMVMSASTSEIPEPILPAGMGVNIHFARGRERDLDMIAAGGFKFIRMDFAWNSIEHKKGDYDWSAYDELTQNFEKRGLSAIYILDYSNSLYEDKVDSHNALKPDRPERGTGSPQHPESIAAFSNWAVASVKHFHGHHIVWEIWNEPNGAFWKPKPNAEQYTVLALATAKAVREAEPGATIVGPALAGFAPPFMETFLKSGVLNYLDAVSVHPYRDAKRGPETAAHDYANLRAQIDHYAPADRKLPILSGEWGYSSKAGSVSPETQAAYLVRQQLFNLLTGVPLSIWYDWQDDGTNPNEVEHHFGTVTVDWQPKPAYRAAKVMTRELAGFHLEKRLEAGTNDYVLLFTNAAGTHKLAAWTTAEPHLAKLAPPMNVTMAEGVNGLGEKFTPHGGEGQLQIDLEAMPKYLTVK